MICRKEKICVKLCSGMNCGIVDCEFNVNVSKNMVHLRKRGNLQMCIYETDLESIKATATVCDDIKRWKSAKFVDL